MGLISARDLLEKERSNVDKDKTAATDEFMKLCRAEFGMGDRPDLRSTWYQTIEDIILNGGPKPIMIAKKLRRNASGKNNPGRTS